MKTIFFTIAGRIYDLIGDNASGYVVFVLDDGIICRRHEICIVKE